MKNIVLLSIKAVLLVIIAVYAFRFETNAKLPFVTSEKTAIYGLIGIGFTMCCVGIAMNFPSFSWANVWSILAAIAGTALLVISLGFIFKWFNFNNEKFLFNLLLVIILGKWLIVTLHHLTPMLRK